jgi:hypothetical protein
MSYSSTSNHRELLNRTRWGYYDGTYFNSDQDFDFKGELNSKDKLHHYLCEFLKDLKDHFDSFQIDPLLSDVTFCDSNQNLKHASRQILSARSAFFDKLLNDGQTNELSGITKSEDQTGRLILQLPDDLSLNVLEALLNYIFWGFVDLKAEDIRGSEIDFFKWASLFDLKELRKEISGHFTFKFTPSNVLDYLKLSKDFQCRHLKSYSIDFITKHRHDVLSTKEWEIFVKNSNGQNEYVDLIKDIYKHIAAKKF